MKYSSRKEKRGEKAWNMNATGQINFICFQTVGLSQREGKNQTKSLDLHLRLIFMGHRSFFSVCRMKVKCETLAKIQQQNIVSKRLHFFSSFLCRLKRMSKRIPSKCIFHVLNNSWKWRWKDSLFIWIPFAWRFMASIFFLPLHSLSFHHYHLPLPPLLY